MNTVTCWSTQGAVVEETIGRIVAAAAHSSSAVSVVLRLTLFVKVGSRGLGEHRKETMLVRLENLGQHRGSG